MLTISLKTENSYHKEYLLTRNTVEALGRKEDYSGQC